MITFTYKEIADSILYAILYGVSYAVFYSALVLVRSIFYSLPDIVKKTVKFDKIFPLPDFSQVGKSTKTGKILSFISPLLFCLGFCVLSYISLDGIIRIYMLILSSASFYLAKIAFYEFFIRIFLLIFRLVLQSFTIIARCLILPIRQIKKYILRIKLRTK